MDHANEVYVPVTVKEFSGLYMVSNHGNVRSLKKGRKILKPSLRGGYHSITLYRMIKKREKKSEKKVTSDIHRLVALAFVDNPHNYRYIRHTDGNNLNNRADNLEWIDRIFRHPNGLAMGKNQVIMFDDLLEPPETGEAHPDFPNYCITEDGKVYNVTKGTYSKLRYNADGYVYVNLCYKGNSKRINVHKLVALLYLDLVPGKDHVNHKDQNKGNNHYSNLEYVTPKENMVHHVEHSGKVKKAVIQYDKKGGRELARYTSVQEAAKAVNIDQSCISNVCNDKQKTAAKCYWRFV